MRKLWHSISKAPWHLRRFCESYVEVAGGLDKWRDRGGGWRLLK
jgi:hypothetical protein